MIATYPTSPDLTEMETGEDKAIAEMREITLNIPLAPTDRASLAAQQLASPPRHLIVGPARYPPFWACATCGIRWSDGKHPDRHAARLLEVEAEPPAPYWDK